MTVEVILNKMKYLSIHNVRFHRIFYHNRFINKYARKKKDKISESQRYEDFLLRYIKTYVLKN